MRVFIYPPTMDWNWMKQRPQQLMKQLARQGNTVFYCNHTQADRSVELVEPRLHVVHRHDRWLDTEWPKFREQLNGPVIVWCTVPKLASTLARYEANTVVYDCVDDFAELAPYEGEMAACADVIVCTAERLEQRLKRQYPGKPVELIRNAYDPDMELHRYSMPHSGPVDYRPPDLPAGPIIGYIGAWAPWVDQSLLQRLSQHVRNEARIVVIGPEFGRKYSLGADSAIHFLGMKPHNELPAYMRHMSVCLIPFRLTPVTLATNPVKAYEYLAAGKPVVSTPLPECQLMQPHVDIAPGVLPFIEAVRFRLRDLGNAGDRTAYALNHTWEQRCRQIEALLARLTAQ
jgi:teichuronic acid biosynthesis glycosyltransferase TuaH